MKKEPVIAVCPGSFDPVTMGHLDIIERASRMFERVIVLVMVNPKKQYSFSPEERIDLLRCATAHLHNITVDYNGGLLADYAKAHNATVIVKGLRAVSDFEYEFQMAMTNKKLNPAAETVFLTTSQENLYLSSSVVKEVASHGGSIAQFVPACVHDRIRDRLLEEVNQNKKG